ncbi:MAG: 50S ribosomal protein L20 [Candidatus Nomurabacteria bacterium]|nr:MAG: 50S ribosomal protein L20 [Candidatus Nomurabacteria bacterium]
MRVKRGTSHIKRRKNLLSRAKGFRWGRKSHPKLARTAVLKAGAHAYRDRRKKKRDFRSLWNIKINAASREQGVTYHELIDKLKKGNINLNRKVLAELAEHEPAVFAEVVKQA